LVEGFEMGGGQFEQAVLLPVGERGDERLDANAFRQ
jgi:hypothetical protein